MLMEEKSSDQALGSSCVQRCVKIYLHDLYMYVYLTYLHNNMCISGYASSWNTNYKRCNELDMAIDVCKDCCSIL